MSLECWETGFPSHDPQVSPSVALPSVGLNILCTSAKYSLAVGVDQFFPQDSEGSWRCVRDNPVSQHSKLICSVIVISELLTCTQPTGKPISCSTQRGFKYPLYVPKCAWSGSRFRGPFSWLWIEKNPFQSLATGVAQFCFLGTVLGASYPYCSCPLKLGYAVL